jgi:hypothetical protein
MLKIYDKLEDVPEALREHYKLIEGKYVPEVSDDHPVKVNNVKLLNEKTAAETKASGLETANTALKADLESARAHSLPRAHKAVPTAEVEAMEQLKAHGTVTEIVTKLTEHKTLKEESDTRKTQDHLREVAKVLEYSPEAFVLLPNLPEFDIRDGADGKKIVIAKIKDGQTITEKPAQEFIESAPHYAPLLPALKVQDSVNSGVRVLGSRSNAATVTGADDLIAQRNQQREDARKTAPNPLMARPAVPGAAALGAK